jgi:hypothetical protein
MWVRTKPEHVEKDRRSKWTSPRGPLTLGIVLPLFVLIISILTRLGFSKWYPSSILLIPWDYFLYSTFKFTLIAFVIVFVACYAWQLITKRPTMREDRIMICDKCDTAKKSDNVDLCECGGKFIDLDEVEWVEDQHETQETNRH